MPFITIEEFPIHLAGVFANKMIEMTQRANISESERAFRLGRTPRELEAKISRDSESVTIIVRCKTIKKLVVLREKFYLFSPDGSTTGAIPFASISTSLMGPLNSRQLVSYVSSPFSPTNIDSSNHLNQGIIGLGLFFLFVTKFFLNSKKK